MYKKIPDNEIRSTLDLGFFDMNSDLYRCGYYEIYGEKKSVFVKLWGVCIYFLKNGELKRIKVSNKNTGNVCRKFKICEKITKDHKIIYLKLVLEKISNLKS